MAVYVICRKAEVLAKFQEYKARAEKELGKSIQNLRSDGGGEYVSKEIADYLRKEGPLTSLPRLVPKHRMALQNEPIGRSWISPDARLLMRILAKNSGETL